MCVIVIWVGSESGCHPASQDTCTITNDCNGLFFLIPVFFAFVFWASVCVVFVAVSWDFCFGRVWLLLCTHHHFCWLTMTFCLSSNPTSRWLPRRRVPVSHGRPVHSQALALRWRHRLYGPERWEQLRGLHSDLWPCSQVQLQGLWWGICQMLVKGELFGQYQ